MANGKFNLGEEIKKRQTTIISAVLALVIVIVGVLIFIYAPKLTTKTTQKEEQKKEESKQNQKQEVGSAQSTVSLPTTYQVEAGDSLSKIAQKFYGDYTKWTEIAKENNLANPSVIHKGNVLKIPKVEVTTKTYTVKKGDTLWGISNLYYGSGFDWYKIRDANKDKVATSSSGRPLIEPGVVLTIP
ncbi:MAG: hypothetical protein A2Y57_03510 [Candidatus Woykebacteria bacterium RBG_13_40_7b]|uniref:LysM domain-containing protein n=1 Tax=Candidatus Woykebacteria bacterium RBG_13_40_7b TaxID=1802594 RepID=A0A1G1W9R6_9BACT|nr:MAG: hypothetical protein A2Y57_03510 [Candidatus Woykebacteria bacterium RBG_13_40_7b]